MRFHPNLLLIVCAASVSFAAGPGPVNALIEMSRREPHSARFREALVAALGAEKVAKGTAVLGEQENFIWAVETAATPQLVVNGTTMPAMTRSNGSNLWFANGKLGTGTSHTFHYRIDGKVFGGSFDVPAYGPDSYQKPGVPQGVLSDKLIHSSRLYEGTKSDYWIYVPAQYDPGVPAALMVWQDGQKHVDRNGATRTLNVIDNLIHAKKIPVMIQVFISPGMRGEARMRSVQYDTVNDTYARFLRDEILAGVQAKYNIRKDGYSRGIAGESSGGICAFNVAWHQPEQFSRVLSRIGSFTSIKWNPGVIDGGNVYPNKVRKEPKRNIRVWLQDGSEDLENSHGSWPLQNIQMANSLKMRDYDFYLSWGGGSHNGAHGNSEAPEALTWLWRDYDPAKTEQVYAQDPAEKTKPYFRVKIYNR